MTFASILAQTTQLNDQTFFLPRQASDVAPQIDFGWNMILITTTIFFFIVVGTMTFFVIKYRRRSVGAPATSTVTHNTPLEIAWTFIPLVIVFCFFYVGFRGFLNYDNPPSNARIIDVQAQQWAFKFTYPNGSQDGQLYLEKNVPVRFNLHSVDVLHAMYIPVMRVQRNLVPFRQTTMWFVPVVLSPPGGFPIFCTQYCGEGHSVMFSHAIVLEKDDYDKKMQELANPFRVTKGGKKTWVPYQDVGLVLAAQDGCTSCHTADGRNSTGPTWKGLWKRDQTFTAAPPEGDELHTLLASDSDAKWEDFIRASFLKPAYDVEAGFGPMPQSFEGTLSGSPANDEKGRAIIEYIKSLGDDQHPYKPDINPKDNPDLFDADHPMLFDDTPEHNPVHPQSLAGIAARKALGLPVGGTASAPATSEAAPAPANR